MNAFASWLCAQEGLNKQISIGDAREIWRVLAIELIGNSERFTDDETGLLAISHPFLTAMIDRGLDKHDRSDVKEARKVLKIAKAFLRKRTLVIDKAAMERAMDAAAAKRKVARKKR